MKRNRPSCLHAICFVYILVSCSEKATLSGQAGSTAVQVMAYASKASFPECSASSKGLMTYNMEDGKFYICNGIAFEMANSVAAGPTQQIGGKATTTPGGLNLCPDASAPDLPSPASNTGMILVNPPKNVDPCSVEGFVVGKEGEVKLKKAKTGELYLLDVPPGDRDIIFKAATAQTLPSGLMLTKPAHDKGARVNKIDVQPGKIKVVDKVEMGPLVTISGKAKLLNKATGTDDAGILVFIPGTSFTALTGTDGSFQMTGVPPGIQNLFYQKEGYARGQIEGINAENNVTVSQVNLILGGTGENGSAVVSNGVKMSDGKFHTNTFDIELAISPAEEAALMMISEDASFKGARWKPVSSSYSISLRQTSASDAIASNPWLTMLYGASQQQNSFSPGVIYKNLNIKFANSNGLETSVFEVPVEIDLFADVPGVRYAMDFSSTVRVYTGAGSVKKVKAELSNIRIPAFASKMSVRRACMYGNCTDTWIAPTSTHTLELGNLGYDLCGRSNIEIKFKDAAEKYVSTTVPVIQSADQWNAYTAKMPNLICSSQKLTNTNAADGPQPPSIMTTPGPYGNSQSLTAIFDGKLYALSKVDGTGTEKKFQMHIFTPSAEGGSWSKPTTFTAPFVRNSEEFVSTGGNLLLTTTKNNNDGSISKEFWKFDVTNSSWSLLSDIAPPNDNSNWDCYDQQGYASLPMNVENGRLTRLCRISTYSYNIGFSTTGFKSFNSTQPIQIVSGGATHTCAYIPAEGASTAGLKCWGFAGYPGVIQGDPNDSSTGNTSKIVTGINPLALSAGYYSSCAIIEVDVTTKVKCWGMNINGSLGIGSTNNNNVYAPSLVKISDSADLQDVSKISSQNQLSCALSSGNKVYCWGSSYESNLFPNGSNWSTTATEMTQFSSVSGITDISVGVNNVCVLSSSGVHCLGKPSSNTTVAVDQSLTNVLKVSAGDGFVCVIRSDGLENEVVCKGEGFANPQNYSATQVGGNPIQLVTGQNYACILNQGGEVYCWRPTNTGYSNSNQAAGSPLDSTPKKISGITNATQLHAGGAHVCVSVSDGLKCFGRNDNWQLGTSPINLTIQELATDNNSAQWSTRKIFMDSNAPQNLNQGWVCNTAPFSVGNAWYVFTGKHLLKASADLSAFDLIGTYAQGSTTSCGQQPVPGNDGFYFEQYSNNGSSRVYALITENGSVEFKSIETGSINSYNTKAIYHSGDYIYTGNSAVNINAGNSMSIDLSKMRPGATSSPSNNKYFNPILQALIPGFGIYIFNGFEMEWNPMGQQTSTLLAETWRINFLDKIATDNP